MPTSSVQVGYRPLRIGFLVRQGWLEDVVEAARLNTLIWGGIRNPIISVGADSGGDVDRAIKAFRADVLHAVADDDGLRAVASRHPTLKWPRDVERRGAFQPVGDGELHAVDMRIIVSHYWEGIFRHGGESTVVWPNWSLDDPMLLSTAWRSANSGMWPGASPRSSPAAASTWPRTSRTRSRTRPAAGLPAGSFAQARASSASSRST